MFTMLRLSLKELKKDALKKKTTFRRGKNTPDIQGTKPLKKWVNVLINQYKN